jgi:hypothetical protein
MPPPAGGSLCSGSQIAFRSAIKRRDIGTKHIFRPTKQFLGGDANVLKHLSGITILRRMADHCCRQRERPVRTDFISSPRLQWRGSSAPFFFCRDDDPTAQHEPRFLPAAGCMLQQGSPHPRPIC